MPEYSSRQEHGNPGVAENAIRDTLNGLSRGEQGAVLAKTVAARRENIPADALGAIGTMAGQELQRRAAVAGELADSDAAYQAARVALEHLSPAARGFALTGLVNRYGPDIHPDRLVEISDLANRELRRRKAANGEVDERPQREEAHQQLQQLSQPGERTNLLGPQTDPAEEKPQAVAEPQNKPQQEHTAHEDTEVERWTTRIMRGISTMDVTYTQGESFSSRQVGAPELVTRKTSPVTSSRHDLVDPAPYLDTNYSYPHAVTNALEDTYGIPRSRETLFVLTRERPDGAITIQCGGNINTTTDGRLAPAVLSFEFTSVPTAKLFIQWMQVDPETAIRSLTNRVKPDYTPPPPPASELPSSPPDEQFPRIKELHIANVHGAGEWQTITPMVHTALDPATNQFEQQPLPQLS